MTPVADPSFETIDPEATVETVDPGYLQSLIGFNARMGALKVIESVLPKLSPHGLRIVDFSVLSLIRHNPGITSRQLCDALNLLPPNLVGKIGAFEKRGLLVRHPHPQDGRALGLHLTAEGSALMAQAEQTVLDTENQVASALTSAERRTLIRLLQKVYLGGDREAP